MDGSTHSENTGVTEFPVGVNDPFAVDQPPSNVDHGPDHPNKEAAGHAQKRAHDESAADDLANDAKRIHVHEEADADNDADELDLDALMAQLQQHAEQAATHDPENLSSAAPDHKDHEEREDHGERPAGVDTHENQDQEKEKEQQQQPDNASGDRREENDNTQAPPQQDQQSAELSIEQQLKGALSSFQDFGLTDSHDDDDFGLSQFAQMLRPNERHPSHTDSHPSDPLPPSSSKPDTAAAKQQQQPGQESPAQDAHSPAGTVPPPAKRDEVAEGREQKDSEDKAAGDSKPGDSGTEDSRETLAAKMPPLPAHGGHLPPMPPPPPALTTPTAPFTAEERSHILNRASQPATEHASSEEPARSEAQGQKPRTRLPDAPPSLSESYEKSLVEQVEEAKKADEQPRAPILSENQAILQARRKSVAVLDSLAAQILEALGCNHYQETLATVTQPNSEKGLAYRLLLDAFEDAKRIFLMHASPSSRNGPESKPDEVRPFLEQGIPGLDLNRENIVTIQRANLATFVAAVFGTIEIGFWELDKWFVQAFVPEGGRLLKQQANIYLDLKTQAYISAVESTSDEEAHKAAMEDLFPSDLDQKLREMFGERTMLAPSERDFVEKCKRRRENIEAEDAKDLSSKYHWVPFLRELSDYVQKNHYTLLPPRQKQTATSEVATTSPVATLQQSVPVSATRATPARRAAPVPSAAPSTAATSHTQASRRTSSPRPTVSRPTPAVGAPAVGAVDDSTNVSQDTGPKVEVQDSVANASTSRTTEDRQQSRRSSESSSPGEAPQAASNSNGDRSDLPPAGHPMFPPLPKQVLPPPGVVSADSQDRSTERARRPGPRPAADAPLVDGPTDTLAAYEAARASAEGTDAVRPRASMFTTRRTWTKEEEEALMKGMDRVQGPYWAQILELYGPGGKISEVLKDRSQVQLKDKARNLKMFFVRLGLPIPAVFQYVTGDYETRKSSGKRIRERKQKAVQGQSPTLSSSVPVANVAPPAQGSTAHHQSQESEAVAPPQQQAQSSGAPSAAPGNSSQESQPMQLPKTQQQPTSQPPQQLQTSESSDSPAPQGPLPNRADENGDKSPQLKEPSSNGDNAGEGSKSSDQNPQKEVERSESTKAADAETQPNEPPYKGQSAPENEVHVQVHQQTEKASEFGDLFPDGDDKEEDINSLLTRVGEFVDNH